MVFRSLWSKICLAHLNLCFLFLTFPLGYDPKEYSVTKIVPKCTSQHVKSENEWNEIMTMKLKQTEYKQIPELFSNCCLAEHNTQAQNVNK